MLSVWLSETISASPTQWTGFNQYAETAVSGPETDKRGQKKEIEPKTLTSRLSFSVPLYPPSLVHLR